MYRCFEDYGRFVCDPIATKRLDEVVSEAVGGLYTETGEIERDGCLASVFGQRIRVDNLGVHVVQPLLDCPKRKSPSRHRLVQHQNLSVPSLDRTADFVCAFSVFAQLLHSERYLYLEDMPRVLRPGGRCPFSFLEFGDPRHSHAFLGKVETRPRRRGGGSALYSKLGYRASCYRSMGTQARLYGRAFRGGKCRTMPSPGAIDCRFPEGLITSRLLR